MWNNGCSCGDISPDGNVEYNAFTIRSVYSGGRELREYSDGAYVAYRDYVAGGEGESGYKRNTNECLGICRE